MNLSYNDRDFRRLHSPSNGSEVVSKVLNENSRSGTPAVGGNVNLMAITATMFNETQAASTAPDSSNKIHSNCLEQPKDQQKQLVPQRSQQQESSAHLCELFFMFELLPVHVIFRRITEVFIQSEQFLLVLKNQFTH